INIIERKCTKCGLVYFIPSDRSLCNDCFDYTTKINHKKEDRIYQVLKSNNVDVESYDRIVGDNETRCSSKRPDFVVDRGTYKIIIEVDENQHETYDCSCEYIRMRQIFFDYGGLHTVFIRYNPDAYID